MGPEGLVPVAGRDGVSPGPAHVEGGMKTKKLDAASHERLRSAMAPFSPPRDDGLDPVPESARRPGPRRRTPGMADVLVALASVCWPLFRLVTGA